MIKSISPRFGAVVAVELKRSLGNENFQQMMVELQNQLSASAEENKDIEPKPALVNHGLTTKGTYWLEIECMRMKKNRPFFFRIYNIADDWAKTHKNNIRVFYQYDWDRFFNEHREKLSNLSWDSKQPVIKVSKHLGA